MPTIQTLEVDGATYSEIETPWKPTTQIAAFRLSVVLMAVIAIVLASSIALKSYILNNPYADLRLLRFGSLAFVFAVYGAIIYISYKRKRQVIEEWPAISDKNLAWRVLANGERGWLVFRNGWLQFEGCRIRFRMSASDFQDPNKAIESWKRRRHAPLAANSKFGVLVVPIARGGRPSPNAVPWKAFSGDFNGWLLSSKPSGRSLLPPLRDETSRNMRPVVLKQILLSMLCALLPSLMFGALFTQVVRGIWPESSSPLMFSLVFSSLIWLIFLGPTIEAIDFGMKARAQNRRFDEWSKGKRVVSGSNWEEPL